MIVFLDTGDYLISARLQESVFYPADVSYHGTRPNLGIPSYEAMTDPLLFEYFAKKFSNPNPPVRYHMLKIMLFNVMNKFTRSNM